MIPQNKSSWVTIKGLQICFQKFQDISTYIIIESIKTEVQITVQTDDRRQGNTSTLVVTPIISIE